MSTDPTKPNTYPCRIHIGNADQKKADALIETIKNLPEAKGVISGIMREDRYILFQCLATHHTNLTLLAEAIGKSLSRVMQVNVPDSETPPSQKHNV